MKYVDFTRGRINLPSEITKTKEGRSIAISARLRPILEMVRQNPATGREHAPHAYVFGNALGQRVGSPKKAWEVTVLKAHDITPEWTKGIKKLTPAMREHLHGIDLHFHDLATRPAHAGSRPDGRFTMCRRCSATRT